MSMDFTGHCCPVTSDFSLQRVDGDVWLRIGGLRFYLSGYPDWMDGVDDALAARLIEAIEPGTTMPEISA